MQTDPLDSFKTHLRLILNSFETSLKNQFSGQGSQFIESCLYLQLPDRFQDADIQGLQMVTHSNLRSKEKKFFFFNFQEAIYLKNCNKFSIKSFSSIVNSP